MDPHHNLARWGASTIRQAFEAYLAEFRAITSRAKVRFETRDWRGHQRDARQRLDLVSDQVWQTMLRLRTQFGTTATNRALWMQIHSLYAASTKGHPAQELAETFFNSVTRRIFSTVGVDPCIEFVEPTQLCTPPEPTLRTFHRRGDGASLLRDILEAYAFAAPYRDLARDAAVGAERLEQTCRTHGLDPDFESVEMAPWVFFRGKGAYLVGRIRRPDGYTPLILALLHGDGGVYLDAVLPTTRDARVLFSFTRSYFHVDVERPSDVIEYLKSLLPMRRQSELYISIGYNKHGKTELYREILHHLSRTDEKFEPAAGDRGMVMVVFTLPSLELVFKVIRDRIPPPKSTSPAEVMAKYNLVFQHDRAGRLVDAQEFEHLSVDRSRFAPEVLDELLSTAGETVKVDGDQVVLSHLYVERRVRPLNLYLREAPEPAALDAVIDYGCAIRDLAATNTFPGDLLLKNFGVTPNGRVIFYDYDELALVTECRFRELPTPRDDQEETSGEPWFYVDPDDIFPEEFIRFLGFTPEQSRTFLAEHEPLLTARFWRGIQERIRGGEVVDIFPYPAARRLSAVRDGEGRVAHAHVGP